MYSGSVDSFISQNRYKRHPIPLDAAVQKWFGQVLSRRFV